MSLTYAYTVVMLILLEQYADLSLHIGSSIIQDSYASPRPRNYR